MIHEIGNIVALLPMKANSERVKGKNFKLFSGRPLFKWILETLLSLNEIDKVVINTDARAVLEDSGVTDGHRIIIRDRKKEICGDMVNMNLILGDDVANVDADIYLMTHSTNPLLSANTIQKALTRFKMARAEGGIDSLFTVNRVQTRFYREDCSPVNHDPKVLLRTQDLETWFEENSNLYIFTKESFNATNARIGAKPMMHITPRFESIDIDDQDDWNMAEVAARYLLERKG